MTRIQKWGKCPNRQGESPQMTPTDGAIKGRLEKGKQRKTLGELDGDLGRKIKGITSIVSHRDRCAAS